MIKYTIDNPTNNKWLNKYNELVQLETGKSVHHILPKKKYPELAKDPKNLAHLEPLDHCKAHYYLWKYDKEYAMEFMFCYYYFRKHYNFKMTDEEEQQLQEDIQWCRKQKKNKEEN